MAELINRPQYLNQLIQNKDVDLVKIVTGIRRSGKSSLLDLFHQYLLQNGIPDSNIIHMNGIFALPGPNQLSFFLRLH